MGNSPILLDQTQRALTTTEVAAVTGLNTSTITEHARKGLIPGAFKPSAAARVSKGKGQRIEWRFNRMVFLQWWEQQQNPGVRIERPMRKKRIRKPLNLN